MVKEDPHVERLVRRLEGPLDPASTRAAEERVWRRLRQPGRETRRFGWIPALGAVALAIALVVGGLWLDSYRLDVASGGLPILYREQVAHADVPTTNGVSGTFDVAQGHFSASSPGRITVVAIAHLRFAEGALPATAEIRYRDVAAPDVDVLARSAQFTEVRRGTADARYDVAAPFPPLQPGQSATYEVWVHVDTATGALESTVFRVEVRGGGEGQRARLIAAR